MHRVQCAIDLYLSLLKFIYKNKKIKNNNKNKMGREFNSTNGTTTKLYNILNPLQKCAST